MQLLATPTLARHPLPMPPRLVPPPVPQLSRPRARASLPAPGPAATDRIDSRILSVLRRDGRISHMKLAEAVHLSPSAVTERVKRLSREGLILGYEARLNQSKLGMGVMVFVEVQLDQTQAEVMQRFKDAVQDCPEVLECHLIAGVFDYLVKVLVTDLDDYEQRVAARIRELPGVRSTRTSAVLEQKDTAPEPRGSRKTGVDDIDAALLRLLQNDGRISNARLAEEVGLTPAAVHERVARLKCRRFILDVVAVVDEERLHRGMQVFAEVQLSGEGRDLRASLRARLQACDEVLEFHEVDGQFDFLVKTRVQDLGQYRDLVTREIWSQPGVRGVRSYAVIDEVKRTSRIPI